MMNVYVNSDILWAPEQVEQISRYMRNLKAYKPTLFGVDNEILWSSNSLEDVPVCMEISKPNLRAAQTHAKASNAKLAVFIQFDSRNKIVEKILVEN